MCTKRGEARVFKYNMRAGLRYVRILFCVVPCVRGRERAIDSENEEGLEGKRIG